MATDPPDAITGRLAALGAALPRLLERTARWVERNLSMDELRSLDLGSWRYRLYHYADYFLYVEAPDAARWRQAILAKVGERAQAQPDAECALGWGWSAGTIPTELVEKRLAALSAAQQEDGGWPDPHGLLQWRPMHTIRALKTLRKQGRDGKEMAASGDRGALA